MSIDVCTIHFTSKEEGASATQFDTHDVGELLELFHGFLLENHMTLVSVDDVEFGEEEDAPSN